MQNVVNKVINDTFFGLCCIIFIASAMWGFSAGSFFGTCSICLAIVFGVAFYAITIIRVCSRHASRRRTRFFWLAVVILLPVIGGLLYYYLRLLEACMPTLRRLGLWQETDVPLQAAVVS